MNGSKQRKGLFFPILLVGLGVFLLLVNLGRVPGTIQENLILFWPVLLILAGLDGLWRRDGMIWPLLLLGLGVLFLLGNLGYLSIRPLPLLSKIWPLLLVAIGIDIAFGRNRGGWHAVLRIGFGILMIGLVFWLAVAFPTAVNTQVVDFDQPIDNAEASSVELNMIAGRVHLTGEAGSDKLMVGQVVIPPDSTLVPQYSRQKNGKSRLVLEVESGNNFQTIDQSANTFEFNINSSLPVELRAEVVVGELQLDLSDTQVRNLESEMAVGSQTITLPCNESMRVDIQQALGLLTINVPRGCNVKINLDNALVNTTLPAGWQRAGDLVFSPKTAAVGANSIEIRIGVAVGAVGIKIVD